MSCQVSIKYKITLCTRSKNKLRVISNLEGILDGYIKILNEDNDDFSVSSFEYIDELIIVYVDSNGTLNPRQIVHKIKQVVLLLLKKDYSHLSKVYSFWLRNDIIESLSI